jgi:soluble lytic murein transglycosylase-like protein
MLLTAMLLHLSPDPFTYASQTHQVPVPILVAISHVESNHHPWALNINGHGLYPRSRQEAEQILEQVTDNVDIGLMQVNYRIWGKSLGLTKVQLLDPYINAWAGAAILRYYLSRYPFWEAVGRYHSGDRNRKVWYAWKIYRALLPDGVVSGIRYLD